MRTRIRLNWSSGPAARTPLVGGYQGDLLVVGSGRQTPTGAAGADTFIVGKNVDAGDHRLQSRLDKLQFEKPRCANNFGSPESSMRVAVQLSTWGARVSPRRGEGRATSNSAT